MQCGHGSWSHALWAVAACLWIASCGSGGGSSGGSNASPSPGSACEFAPIPGVFVDRWLSYQPVNVSQPGGTPATSAQWPYFYQPETIEGPPCGTNANGLFDGVSLGYDGTAASTLGGFIVIGFGDANGHRCAVDDGTSAPDLAVYGNQFYYLDSSHTYNKIATVEVASSYPAGPWYLFPPSFNPNGCNTAYPGNTLPSCYVNFAGVMPTSAGGDMFDLGSLGLGPTFQACYVRLTDGGTLYPDFGDTQTDLYEGGAAIDAVQALTSAAASGLTP